MFSGGLDSVIATHLLKNQGLEVVALHFVLPFESGLDIDHRQVRGYAAALGVQLEIQEEGEPFLDLLRSPAFGFGKNANPCVDCRIHRLQKARAYMDAIGAAFVATGEVVGQRPMSQQKNIMRAIEKRCGLEGYLLRPLSAHLLEETVVEREGLVNRDGLLAFSGRSRKAQLAYAKQHGLKHASPGGGCLLTMERTAARFNNLAQHQPNFDLSDFKLIARGRHFRISPRAYLVVGRNDSENNILLKLIKPGDCKVLLADVTGPLGLLRGEVGEQEIETTCRIMARYARNRQEQELVGVRTECDMQKLRHDVVPLDEAQVESMLL
jgi:tRNA U34 2-thiouridine synthase MnmA/TrmU